MHRFIGFAAMALVALVALVALGVEVQAQQVNSAESVATGAPGPNVEQAQRDEADKWPTGPGTGPYAALMEVDENLAEHVVYRPANLSQLRKKKLGILVWGNGGCRNVGSSARHHLAEIASWGYLVVAPGRILSGPTATARPVERTIGPDGKRPPIATTWEDVRAGLDWAMAENTREGSNYRGRIDTKAVAVGGHSCGGLQALQMATDPRIRTVIVHNSGIFPGTTNPIVGMTIEKADLAKLHTPIVYFTGGQTDGASSRGIDDFNRIEHVPAALVDMPVGHNGTFWHKNGGAVASASVDWLEWHLRGDNAAARTFAGENCRLCTVKGWTLLRKNIR